MGNKERKVIFFDGSNLYHILRKICGSSGPLVGFDFNKFIDKLIKDRKLVGVYYYTAPLDRKKDEEVYRKQQRFFEKLKRIPNFKLVLCGMQREKIDGKTIYIIKEDDIPIALLVSSDGDFVPAVNAVQETGKRVGNIGFSNKFSWHLRQECDLFSKLNKSNLDRCFED